MELNVNVKVTIEASPTILGLLDGWMNQLENQQATYLSSLMDTVESRMQMNELAAAAEPIAEAPKTAVKKVTQKAEQPEAKVENTAHKNEQVEEKVEAEPQKALPKNEKQAEPMTKEEEEELRKLASQFIRAKAENRVALKQWLDSRGFSRVTAVTRDSLEELKEVLKVA